MCYIRYGRRPAHHSVKHIATAGPPPALAARRYQPWHLIADPADRKLAVIRLHSEGWSITSIAEYLQTTRATVYATLRRWIEEGVAGLEEKSRARKGPRKVTLAVQNEIRKLQENPLLGKWRMHTALLRLGIALSPATCARVMAANRQLYGLEKPPRSPHGIRWRCPLKPLGAISTGVVTFALSKDTCCPIPGRSMPLRSSRIFRAWCFLPKSLPRRISGTICLFSPTLCGATAPRRRL